MMRKTALVVLLLFTILTSTAEADWRWAGPKPKHISVGMVCDKGKNCNKVLRRMVRKAQHKRVVRHNRVRQAEWDRVISVPVPRCTWYGESGVGPEFARYRYTLPNSKGSGAYGKYQFMKQTYFNNAKYGDWSPLDQEIAVRGEVAKHSIYPWTNCTS